MMNMVAGVAAARQFVTHRNKLNMWLFVRIAPELYLMELVIDEEGHISQTRLRVQDVFVMIDSPTRILTQWNRNNQPVGDSSSLLVGFLGQVASNFGNFPVLYENWTQGPEQYKNNVYVNTIQANFVVNDEKHKQYILGSLGKKWKDKRCRLFDKYHNWELSVEENIQNHPPIHSTGSLGYFCALQTKR
ncbi:hypothetical protein Fmac_018574 [Flemingia macrophylla]|uniref:Uncharacterized protein n=1 Tax=Flemingia macrophylla TaxID=520843 RepID=A0ABD1M617_9FABA